MLFPPYQYYLNYPAVYRHCSANHMDIWCGCRSLSLGKRPLRGRIWRVECEGMRCRIPVLGTEKERERKGKLWLFFPLLQLKNNVQCNLCKSNIRRIPNRTKTGIYTLTKLFGQLNHSQFNLGNKLKNLKILSAHILI